MFVIFSYPAFLVGMFASLFGIIWLNNNIITPYLGYDLGNLNYYLDYNGLVILLSFLFYPLIVILSVMIGWLCLLAVEKGLALLFGIDDYPE